MKDSFRQQCSEAVQLKKEKRYDEAWERFRKLASLQPRSAYFWSNFSHLALLKKRYRDARRFAEMALSIDPQNWFCRSIYVSALLQQNEIEQALPVVQELFQEKLDKFLLKTIVKTCERVGKLEMLSSCFQEWLLRYDQDAEFVVTAAEYYHKIGDDDKAIELYQKLLDQQKASDFAYQRLLAIKTKGKSREEKIRELELIARMPSQKENIHLLGLLAQEYRKQKMFEKAEQVYRKITQLAPNDLFHKKQIGFFYAKKGDYQQAVEFLSKCLLQDPDDIYVRSSLFSALKKLDAKETAIQIINQILARYPEKEAYFGFLKKVDKW